MLNHPLRIAVATAALAAFPVAAQAAGGKTETLRFYSVPQQIVVTQADGTIVDHAPYPDMAPGDTLDVYSQDFAGNHKRHAKRAAAGEHLRCVFSSASPEPDCESHVAFRGGLMVWHGDTLVAGSGRFFGATGKVLSMKEVAGDASDIVARIHLK